MRHRQTLKRSNARTGWVSVRRRWRDKLSGLFRRSGNNPRNIPNDILLRQPPIAKARQALQESEQRFRFIMECIPQKIFTAKPNSDVDYYNPCWTEYSGLPFEEISDSGWIQLVHPDDLEDNLRNLKDSIENGRPVQIEHRFRRHDGMYRWHITRALPMRDETGKIIMWVGSSTDVDDLKETQTELARLTAESEKQRRLYETILSNTPDLIYVFDLEQRFAYANDALLATLGKSWSEVKSKSCAEIDYPKGFAALHDQQIAQVKASKQAIRGDVPLEGKDGVRTYDYILVPVLGQDGEVEAVAGTARDVTDRKRLEDDLRQSAADLSEADRKKDEFLSTLAHELRNPLAPIRTGIELMRTTGDSTDVAEEVRGMMEGQLSHLVRLVDDLLDTSRITQGKMTLRKERVELKDIVGRAVQATASFIKDANQDLEVKLPEEPLALYVDPTRITQVLSNLLVNAAKYSLSGGRIVLSVERLQDDLILSIKDTGIGIPEDMLENIFGMFTQVDQSLEKSHGGLGIGLTLVKRLVEMHEGTVTARSEGPGKGSEFIVRLPIGVPPVAAAATQKVGESTRQLASLKILIVDDNRDAARLLSILASKSGNEVHVAHDGLEAIEAAAEFLPNIILMDIGMPRLNGYEAARQIRQQPWGQEMLLVALTGWGQQEDIRRTQDAGFDFHFVKPVDISALRKLLAEYRPRTSS